LYELGETRFEEEIEKSITSLKSIIGEKPIGFRAPSFSMNNSTRWALEVLVRHGFKYDASIFPIKTMLYGEPNAPLDPYRPSIDDVTQDNPDGEIIEFPMTVLKLGKNIPIAGGFYLRALPLWFLKLAIRRVNVTRPAIIYIHPWETYPRTPRLGCVPLFSRFVTYHGINSVLKKVEGLLEKFEFKSLREFLEDV
jgi:polysaccharide deacetylase family protein (PEP-CTERM system associated)